MEDDKNDTEEEKDAAAILLRPPEKREFDRINAYYITVEGSSLPYDNY